jgi:hypothetical protein
MTLDLAHLSQRTTHEADPWASAESWPSTWPSPSAVPLGVTPDGEVIGHTPRHAAPRPVGHVVALSNGRRAR